MALNGRLKGDEKVKYQAISDAVNQAWNALEGNLQPKTSYSLPLLCCKAQAAVPPQASPASTRSTRSETEETEQEGSGENEEVRSAAQVNRGAGVGLEMTQRRGSKAANNRVAAP